MAVSRNDRNRVELVGEVTGEPRVHRFESGSTLLSFSLRTRRPEAEGAGAENVPVAWWEPQLGAGDLEGRRVKVVGHVRRRFYQSPAGLRSTVEVVAGQVDV